MTITYELGDSLYVNVTNRCTNNCAFCVRNHRDSVLEEGSLWINREPSKEEIFDDIKVRDLSKYDELVFCGYGEPFMRFFDVIWIARRVKETSTIPIRVNTNGQVNLICGEDVTDKLEGAIDILSISLNAKNATEYARICKPQHGEAAFDAMLDFAKSAAKHVKRVVMTVVDTLPEADIEQCAKIAKSVGAQFKVRKFIE